MTLDELSDFLKKDKRNDELVIDDLISLAKKKLACDLEKLNHQSIRE